MSSSFILKVADFLLFLRKEKRLSVSVFKYKLHEIHDSFILKDLIRSFEIERPLRPVGPPYWDLVKLLYRLRGSFSEPLHCKPLKVVMMKTLFLLSLATAKRVGELQAISCRVAFQGPDISLSYLLNFVTKTESERNPLPQSFLVKSLVEFVGDLLEERLLCPVRAVRTYLDATSSLAPRPRSLFVSPRCPSRSLSKNALSYFLHQVISTAGAIQGDQSCLPRAHSIRGVATCTAFLHNWSVSKVLEVATWRSKPVFAYFYLRDIYFTLDELHSLRPFVVAGSVGQ